MQSYFYAAGTALLLVLILGPILIPLLKRLKFGQSILEDGPSWHQAKQGTPTMGGVMFIVAITVGTLLFARDERVIAMTLAALGFGAVGFLDDYIKVVKKRNLGLTARQKFLLQAVVAVAFAVYVVARGMVSTDLVIPYLGTVAKMPVVIYLPFIVLVMLAMVNSVNLTDGLDGLATTVTLLVTLFFGAAAIKYQDTSIGVAAFAVAGGCIGFLFFNSYPAKVFMGDTGSLYLGGILSAMAILLDIPVFFGIAGGIFLAETLSVIIQVTSFKTTGKRVFKMSPLHHHFEMCGWKERKIVLIFGAVTLLLGLFAYFGL